MPPGSLDEGEKKTKPSHLFKSVIVLGAALIFCVREERKRSAANHE